MNRREGAPPTTTAGLPGCAAGLYWTPTKYWGWQIQDSGAFNILREIEGTLVFIIILKVKFDGCLVCLVSFSTFGTESLMLDGCTLS